MKRRTHEHGIRSRGGRIALAALSVVAAGAVSLPPAAALHAPPSTPNLISPPDGAVIRPNVATLFTVTTVDPDGEPAVGEVTIRQDGNVVTTFPTSPTVPLVTSNSTGTPGILPPGSYTWSARARDAIGLWSPSSGERSFTMVAGGTIGGGVLRGSQTYDGDGLVPPLWPCTPSTSSFSASSPATVAANLGIIGYAGPVSVTGTTSSACETAGAGGGSVTLGLTGFQPSTESSLSCDTLSGNYTRTATDLRMTVSGSCTMNAFVTESLVVTLEFQTAPSSVTQGEGITRPATRWRLEGGFAVTST